MEIILLFIKHHMGFIWDIVEWLNACLFSLRYGKTLDALQSVKEIDKNGYIYRMINEDDLKNLSEFFARQPENQFEFFKPHAFDLRSLQKQFKNKAFIMLGCWDGNKLIGYQFLRCFFIGKAFRGRIVDSSYQGKGIAKHMGLMHTSICHKMNLRLFLTVCKDNVASLASSKAVNNIKIVKELPNNYLLVECIYKELTTVNSGGGVNRSLAIMLQAKNSWSYVAYDKYI